MSSSGSSTSRAPPPPPPGGNNLGVAEEDRIEVAHVRPQPPPPPPPAMAAMLPYHHRSRNNDDPDFQTTTLTRPVAEGPAGELSNFVRDISLAGNSNVSFFRGELVKSDRIRPRH